MAWVVRRPVMQRWVLVVTTWLRAVWTILLVVLARWLVVRSGVVLAWLMAAHSVHLRLVSRSLQIATWYLWLEGTSSTHLLSSWSEDTRTRLDD